MVEPLEHQALIRVDIPLPENRTRSRSLSAGVCSLVCAFDDQIGVGYALAKFSEFMIEMFTKRVCVRPINLWKNEREIEDLLRMQGLEVSFSIPGNQTSLVVSCHSVPEVAAALTVLFPNADALVCYQPQSDRREQQLWSAVSERWAVYEGRFAPELVDYGAFAFMESGRLSIEVLGNEETIVTAFSKALRLRSGGGLRGDLPAGKV